jgi:hypothetical protein
MTDETFEYLNAVKDQQSELIDTLTARVGELERQIRDHHSDLPYVMGWNSGFDHAVKELFKLKFPTMPRKMWSGSEVQGWIDNQTADLRRAAAAMEGKP